MYLLILILLFLFCFGGILVTAYFSIEAIKAVAERFKLSDTFVGAVFLSIGTSFPEFINSIVSGFMDRGQNDPKHSLFSFYNVTGANLWQVVFLVLVLGFVAAIYGSKKKSEELGEVVKIFWEESWLSWNLILWETIFLLFIFILPAISGAFVLWGFSLCNLVFLLVWLHYLKHTYNCRGLQEERMGYRFFVGWNKYALVAVTILLWSLFGIFAYGNFYISSKFPMDSSTSFGVILSFITSSPEFSVLCLLFRKKEYRIAVGGFFGSSLFNLTLPLYSNLISRNPIMGRDFSFDAGTGYHLTRQKLVLWLGANIVFLLLFLFSFGRSRILRASRTVFNAVLVGCLYGFTVYIFNKQLTSWAEFIG